ncbi:hypothetical protein [Chitinophaga sp. CF418]|uniref:hypothetical protein n=1 Tax=Chitinophaga sp. CF418 TaxID=1855287 RepID=UPI00165F6961|nr:hypothetical protein [Chitinophaga sp. CF418]
MRGFHRFRVHIAGGIIGFDRFLGYSRGIQEQGSPTAYLRTSAGNMNAKTF